MDDVKKQAKTISEEYADKIRADYRNDQLMRYAPVMVLLLLVTTFGIICGNKFLSIGNLVVLLNQFATPLVIAMGLTFVIITGGIDLSINGVVGMAASIFGIFVLNTRYAQNNLGWLAVLIAVAACALAGFLIGLIHVKSMIPSFMVSFAFMYICKGIGLCSYAGIPPAILDPVFIRLGQTSFLSIPFINWVAFAVFAACLYLQEYTPFGRHIYAIGANEDSPRSVGVNVGRTKILVFMIAGVCNGIAGVLGAIRMCQGQVAIGNGLMFPAQAAVVIGGTALSGGKGGVINTVVGVLIMTVLENGLLILAVNPYIKTGIEGLIILLAVILSVPRGSKVISK